MPQPIKRYHIRRPDGSWTHQIGKIAGADDVSDDEINEDIQLRQQKRERHDEPDDDDGEEGAPDEPEESEDGEESGEGLDMEKLKEMMKRDPANNNGNMGYARRGKRKKKKNKPVIINKKTKKNVQRAFKNFLYKRPKKKKAVTWRPRLDRHPKPKNIKFFQNKKQPQRRSIIKRR